MLRAHPRRRRRGAALSARRSVKLGRRSGRARCCARGINYKGHAEENPNAKMPTSRSSSPSCRPRWSGPTCRSRSRRDRADGLRGRVLGGDRQAAVAGPPKPSHAGDLRLHAAQRHLGARRPVQGQPDHLGKNFDRLRADRPLHRHRRRAAASRQRAAEDPAERQDACRTATPRTGCSRCRG